MILAGIVHILVFAAIIFLPISSVECKIDEGGSNGKLLETVCLFEVKVSRNILSIQTACCQFGFFICVLFCQQSVNCHHEE